MTEHDVNFAWHGDSAGDLFITEFKAVEGGHGVLLGIMAAAETGDAVIALHVQYEDDVRVAVQFTPDEALLFAQQLVRLEILAREALAEAAWLMRRS